MTHTVGVTHHEQLILQIRHVKIRHVTRSDRIRLRTGPATQHRPNLRPTHQPKAIPTLPTNQDSTRKYHVTTSGLLITWLISMTHFNDSFRPKNDNWSNRPIDADNHVSHRYWYITWSILESRGRITPALTGTTWLWLNVSLSLYYTKCTLEPYCTTHLSIYMCSSKYPV